MKDMEKIDRDNHEIRTGINTYCSNTQGKNTHKYNIAVPFPNVVVRLTPTS